MKPTTIASRIAFALGALGLFGAMAVDFIAVIGRHAGVPLLGSIELSEACIVCMASASLLGTTLARGHASAQVLTQRLGAPGRQALARLADALGSLFFAFVALGSMLLLVELRHGDERSELLAIPIVALRAIWCAAVTAMVFCFAARVVASDPKA